MVKRIASLLGAGTAFVLVSSGRILPEAEPPAAATIAAWGSRPLAFERNDGQTDPRVRFVARTADAALFVEESGLVLAPRQGAPLRMRFAGGSSDDVAGEEPLPGVVHYLRGNDRSKWIHDVPLFARSVCRSVWPGIDVVLHGAPREVEYDFRVAPGADASAIAVSFEGADEARVEASGDLVVSAAGRTFRHLRPHVFEQDGDARREVEGAFVARADGTFGFRLAEHDPARTLVIDPVIAYATYLGGSDAETPFDVAVDAAGDVVMSGVAISLDYPLANVLPGAGASGGTDAFVTKLNGSGTKLLYSSYLGGGGTDAGWAVRVGVRGIYVAGSTTSSDFPAISSLAPFSGGAPEGDAFLTVLSANGTEILLSTYLGGSDDDGCRALALDSVGNAYLAGFTSSSDFPTTTNAAQRERLGAADAWAAKIDLDTRTLAYATYLGGSSAPEAVTGAAVTTQGDLVVAGYTASPDLPFAGFQKFHAGGQFDGFVARLSATGGLVAGTYLGGFLDDGCRRVAVDGVGNVYVTGFTGSENFPVANPLQRSSHGGEVIGDGFVTELDPQLANLVFSTYLGGARDDDSLGIALGPLGAIYVAGTTSSEDFPSKDPVQQAAGGGRDAFLAKIAPSGTSLEWSSVFGNAGDESAAALTTDSAGDAYLALSATAGLLPTQCAYQADYAGGQSDVYVLKISDTPSVAPATPLDPIATADSAYHVGLRWTDASGNECGFRVERSVDGADWQQIGTTATDVVTLSDPDVAPDHDYAYRVFAVNPLGESLPSEEVHAPSGGTVVLAQRQGSLRESERARSDQITVHVLLRMNVASADGVVDPAAEAFHIAVGTEAEPVVVDVPAGDPRWKRKKSHSTWTSPRKSSPRARFDFDSATMFLTVTLSHFDFPVTPAGDVHLSMRCGNDAGRTARVWTPKKKPGSFKLP